MNNLFLYWGLSVLIAHELDAMTQAEWRLLFGLRKLPEQHATSIFVAIHVPAIAGILWLTHHTNTSIQVWSRLGVAVFLIIHASLHRALEHDPRYTFNTLLSKGLIYGGGLIGLLYCIDALIVLTH